MFLGRIWCLPRSNDKLSYGPRIRRRAVDSSLSDTSNLQPRALVADLLKLAGASDVDWRAGES